MILDGDGFDHYGGDISKMLSLGIIAAYGSSSVENTELRSSLKRTGTHSLYIPGSTTIGHAQVRRVIPAPARNVIGVGFALYMPGLPSVSSIRGVTFMDVNATPVASFDIKTDGRVGVHRGDINGTQIGQSTLPVLQAAAWNFVEFKIGRNSVTGITGMRVNNTEVDGLMLTNVNTNGGGDFTQIRLGDLTSQSGGGAWYVDDYVVWDSLGDYNNDWVGDEQMLWRPPTGDHPTIAEFTPDSGTTLWDRIDEANPSSADYMRALVPDKQAAFTFDDVPSDIADIAGVIPYVLAKKLNPGTCRLQAGMLTDGIVGDAIYQTVGADINVTTTDTMYRAVLETNPATGLPYTPAEINGSHLYIDRTE